MVVWMLVVVRMRMEMVVTVRVFVIVRVIGSTGVRVHVSVFVRMARVSEDLVGAGPRLLVAKKDAHECRPSTGDGR